MGIKGNQVRFSVNIKENQAKLREMKEIKWEFLWQLRKMKESEGKECEGQGRKRKQQGGKGRKGSVCYFRTRAQSQGCWE